MIEIDKLSAKDLSKLHAKLLMLVKKKKSKKHKKNKKNPKKIIISIGNPVQPVAPTQIYGSGLYTKPDNDQLPKNRPSQPYAFGPQEQDYHRFAANYNTTSQKQLLQQQEELNQRLPPAPK